MAYEPVDEFFDALLTTPAEYTHPTSGWKEIDVIFFAPFARTEVIDGAPFQNSAPEALAKTSEVEDATTACTLTISSTTYYVIGVEPDGHGITRLILSETGVA